MPETPQLPEGLRERYSVVRIIGRGGMGVVLEAIDRNLKRPVALKLIAIHGRESYEIKAYFVREARALAAISHPGIVRVLDGDVAGDMPYLAMELLAGATLHELAQVGRPASLRVATWLEALLDALACVHEHGMLHRDLKPSNIFIESSGRPVLIDFGLVSAGESTRLTATGQVLGTPRFLAPEILAGADPSASTDLFALAMSAVEALTGTSPHIQPGVPGTLETILSSLMSGTYHATTARLLGPGPFAAVLLRALEPNPAARFASARRMREAVLALPDVTDDVGALASFHTPSAPLRAVPLSAVPPTPMPRGRARWLTAVPLVLAGAVGAGLCLVLMRAAPVPPPASPPPAVIATPSSAAPSGLMPAAVAHALHMKIVEQVVPPFDALEAELEGFTEWEETRQIELTAINSPTRDAKHEYLALRRKNGRAPALNVIARDITRALGVLRPIARELFSRDQPPADVIPAAYHLTNLREAALQLDLLGSHGAAQLQRVWLDGQPETLGSEYLRALIHRSDREHVARARRLQMALERMSSRRAGGPMDVEDAYAVGSLTLELLDALRQQPSIDRARVRASAADWATWQRLRPSDPRIVELDLKIRGFLK